MLYLKDDLGLYAGRLDWITFHKDQYTMTYYINDLQSLGFLMPEFWMSQICETQHESITST